MDNAIQNEGGVTKIPNEALKWVSNIFILYILNRIKLKWIMSSIEVQKIKLETKNWKIMHLESWELKSINKTVCDFIYKIPYKTFMYVYKISIFYGLLFVGFDGYEESWAKGHVC